MVRFVFSKPAGVQNLDMKMYVNPLEVQFKNNCPSFSIPLKLEEVRIRRSSSYIGYCAIPLPKAKEIHFTPYFVGRQNAILAKIKLFRCTLLSKIVG